MTTAIQLQHYYPPMVDVVEVEWPGLHRQVHVPIASNKSPIFQSTSTLKIHQHKKLYLLLSLYTRFEESLHASFNILDLFFLKSIKFNPESFTRLIKLQTKLMTPFFGIR